MTTATLACPAHITELRKPGYCYESAEWDRLCALDAAAANCEIERLGGVEQAAPVILRAEREHYIARSAANWPDEMRPQQQWLQVLLDAIVSKCRKGIETGHWFSGIDDSGPGAPRYHPDAKPGTPQGRTSEWYDANGWIYIGGMGNFNNTHLYWLDPETVPEWLRPHLERQDISGGLGDCLYLALRNSLDRYAED